MPMLILNKYMHAFANNSEIGSKDTMHDMISSYLDVSYWLKMVGWYTNLLFNADIFEMTCWFYSQPKTKLEIPVDDILSC